MKTILIILLLSSVGFTSKAMDKECKSVLVLCEDDDCNVQPIFEGLSSLQMPYWTEDDLDKVHSALQKYKMTADDLDRVHSALQKYKMTE